MIPYGKHNISDEDIQAVVDVLRGECLTQGPMIEEFENKFAAYIGAKYAVAVSSGTAALHLAALTLGCKSGQKVITTPITFAASANCVRYCGADVYFSDIDSDTYLLDLDYFQNLLRSHPKGYFSGVIPVDFAGLPFDLIQLKKICDEYGLWILHDACHSPGARFAELNQNSFYSGDCQFSDMAIFSFHPVKHIATGEGGMVTTNNPEHYAKLKKLRTHGITKNSSEMEQLNQPHWYYEMQDLGYNYRLTDIQAALGVSQLGRAETRLLKRQKIAKNYDQAFEAKIKFQKTTDHQFHAFHLYVIEVERRNELYAYLKESKIYAQVHYIPVYRHPYYQNINPGFTLPIAEAYYSKCLSLPMYPELTEKEQNLVIQKVLGFYGH